MKMEVYMEKSSKKIILLCTSLAILVLALTFCLLDALIPLNLWTHPILNFLFVAFAGFGVLSLVYGFKFKSSGYIFLGTILLSLAIFYLFIQFVFWWLSLIIVLFVSVVLSIVSVCCVGNKTEHADNKSPDYKDYNQRMLEKEALEQQKEPEELPEIKSFK